MKKERIEQLKANLRGLGTKADKLYTNQEIIDLLKDLQGALAKGVFEKTHAENLRDQDIVIHFEALAREYGLDNSDTYLRFKENMGELGYTIGSFIKGMSGERIARRALKLLSYEKGVHILYNVQLEDEDVQAEYDAIVVAPYGMFVVEVKNWGLAMTISPNGLLTRDDNSGIVYDLPGRMSVKEALLREHLKELFPEHYQSILLLSSEKAQVQDYYQKIIISCGGGISYEIKAFEKAGKVMSEEQTTQIANKILAQHVEQRAICPVKCEEIIEDYAILMAQIEEASKGLNEIADKDETKPKVIHATETINKHQSSKWYERIDWRVVGEYAVSIVPTVLPVIVCAFSQSRKR
jgi:hypothetical protein